MASLQGRVYVVEPLGRQREVTIQIGQQRVAVVTPHEDVAPDSLATLSAPRDRLLLFDEASGRRIDLAARGDAALTPVAAEVAGHG